MAINFGGLLNEAVGGIGSALVGGAASAFGASQANTLSSQLLDRQNMFSREEAATARAFNERMSRRAYRYTMEDMRLAGLNPILAYQQGSNQTGGPGGSAVGTPAVRNELGEGAASALAARRQYADLKQMDQSIDLMNAQREKTEVDARKGDAETKNIYKVGDILDQELHSAKAAATGAKITEQVLEQHPWLRKLDIFSKSLQGASGAASSAKSVIRR